MCFPKKSAEDVLAPIVMTIGGTLMPTNIVLSDLTRLPGT